MNVQFVSCVVVIRNALLLLYTDHGEKHLMNEFSFYVQHLMENPTAPQAITEFPICKCEKGCLTKSFSCRKYDLLCTDACICFNFWCEKDANDS